MSQQDFGHLGETALKALGRGLAALVENGDTILLEGPVGAGKSTFARALISHCLAKENRTEDIPSPTFTLVQTYELEQMVIWHADLYRLGDASEVIELGLSDAFQNSVCLIEWPEIMAELQPKDALYLRLSHAEDDRHLVAKWVDEKWTAKIAAVLQR